MSLKSDSKHKKLLAWKALAKAYNVMKKAQKNPHYWIEEQNRRIPEFVHNIYTIPFYKKRFDEAGITPDDIKTREDFKKLPPLYKEEYREWLLSETKDKEKFKYWMHRQTTGSSGTPLDLYSLPTDRAAEIANLSRCALIQNKGFNPVFGRIFSTMVPKPGPPPKWYQFPYNGKMSSISEPADLVDGYNKARPDFYFGNKTAVLMIAQYSVEHNIPLHQPKCVGSISEPLYETDRKIMNQAYGKGRLFDIYGCAETGNFAVDRPEHPGKHIIWNDTHVVNLLNEEETGSSVFTGQLMLTSLIHRGFPLVNYVVGDTVELTLENEVPYITKILGRTNDEIKNQDGTTFKWMHINRIMFGLTDITQFRIIQDSITDITFVLASKNMTISRKKEIEDLIDVRSKNIFGIDMNVTAKNIHIKWVDRIPPDPNGKIRILVSNVK